MHSLQKPSLSIVVHTWNREIEIVRNLQSLLPLIGTTSEVEIIVSDNSSNDSTVEKVLLWSEKNCIKTILLMSDVNRGPLLNWMRGVEAANGKYVHLLFSDDYIRPSPRFSVNDLLQTIKSAEENQVKLISLQYTTVDNVLNPSPNPKLTRNKAESAAIIEPSYATITTNNFLYNYILPESFCQSVLPRHYSPVSPSCYIIERHCMLKVLHKYKNIPSFMSTGAGIDQLCILEAASESKYIIDYFLLQAVMVASSTSITVSAQANQRKRNRLLRIYNFSFLLFAITLLHKRRFALSSTVFTITIFRLLKCFP